MGTRARVAVQQADGKFRSIYTHWDGYPSHHGPLLLAGYNTIEQANALMDLGDISSLDATIETCCAYARDRGETDVAAEVSATLSELSKLTQESGGEYLYLFRDGQWFCAKGGVAFFGNPASKEPGTLLPLVEVLKAEEAAES